MENSRHPRFQADVAVIHGQSNFLVSLLLLFDQSYEIYFYPLAMQNRGDVFQLK